jgi:hypothetical protein
LNLTLLFDAVANVIGDVIETADQQKAVTRSHLPVGVRRLHSASYDQAAI